MIITFLTKSKSSILITYFNSSQFDFILDIFAYENGTVVAKTVSFIEFYRNFKGKQNKKKRVRFRYFDTCINILFIDLSL